jgi:hypothetical protein
MPGIRLGSARRLALLSGIVVVIFAAWLSYKSATDRPYDSRFDTKVAQPAYTKDHPCVFIDEAHRNLHTASGTYKPFADLLANDGYDVRPYRLPFSARIKDASVLVIACAKGSNDTKDGPAFTDAEVDVVVEWVKSGGALLLVTDHYPFGSAVEALSARFGVDMSKGMVEDPEHFESRLEPSHLVFSRENGLLKDHAVTCGRSASEVLQSVLTFTGQSVKGPAEATAFLSLADTAVDRTAVPKVERSGSDVRVLVDYVGTTSARGRAQGIALESGQGRVVVLGEAGMLSAQRDRRGQPVGMNFPGYDNRQLVLNILHWLSRLI